MRLHAIDDRSSVRGKNIFVYLDGVRQKDVVLADEEAGLIIQYDWPYRPDPRDPINLRTHTLRGDVRVVVAERLLGQGWI